MQGQDSGKIIIWNMGPVIDKTKENDKDVPRVLCQMDHHIGRIKNKI
jgi:protein HIRA/HIR1